MTRFLPAIAAAMLVTHLCAPVKAQAPTPTAEQIFARSLAAIGKVDSYQGVFVMRELIGDDLEISKVEFKFKKPFKVYMKYLTKPVGQEVLFVRGENDDEIMAHKGSFPDITVNLNPYGRMAMKDSHQPILTFGLQKQIEIMGHIHRKAVATGQVTYTVKDAGVFMGEPVWEVEAKLPSTGKKVEVLEDENLWQLAKRTGQTMYVILHYNDLKSPSSIDEGDEVFVPDHYGSRVRYLIGQKSLMPLQETSWDHKGRVYESYDYPSLELDAGLTDADFDPENEAYDF